MPLQDKKWETSRENYILISNITKSPKSTWKSKLTPRLVASCKKVHGTYQTFFYHIQIILLAFTISEMHFSEQKVENSRKVFLTPSKKCIIECLIFVTKQSS